jgi:chromosome segregation ATPase
MFTQADKRKLLETMKELDTNEPVKLEQLEAIASSAQARLDIMEEIKKDTDKMADVQLALADLQTVAWPRMADYIDEMRGNITEVVADMDVIKSDLSLLRANMASMQADITAIKDVVLKAPQKP